MQDQIELPKYYNLFLTNSEGNPTVYVTFEQEHEGLSIGQIVVPEEDYKHLLSYTVKELIERLYEVSPAYIEDYINTTVREPLKHLQVINLEEGK